MKKHLQPIEVEISSQSHDGRGIAQVDGKTIFIDNALLGEKVKCQILKTHRRYNEAIATEILNASPHRVEPACPHYTVCGGCSLQHMDALQQIQFKEKMLLEQLTHFGKVTPLKILPPLMANFLNYRRKARLGVRYVRKKEKLLIGFREKFSNYLADIESCPVLHEKVGTRLKDLSCLIQSLSQYENIPQVEVAVSDEEVALVFRHMQDLTAEDIEKLCAFGNQFQFHIYLQPNAPQSVQKIWPRNSPELLNYSLPAYDLNFQFHPQDFTQINYEINQQMVSEALKLLDPEKEDIILDLFCGLGNFTLPLSRFAKKVVGVEGSLKMVERATQNASLNHIHNAEFFAANLMEPDKNALWMQNKYNKILLDPPRSGAKEIIQYFKDFLPQKIVYISCNPATLARDAGELVYNYRYTLKAVGVINMFPHTSHTEAMALFEL